MLLISVQLNKSYIRNKLNVNVQTKIDIKNKVRLNVAFVKVIKIWIY